MIKMKSISKIVWKSIIGLALVSFVFVIYCITITKVTPWLYESFGCETIIFEQKTNTDTCVASNNRTNYGDEYNNDRIGVLGTFGDSAGFMNAFFSLLAFTAVVLTFMYQYYKDGKTDLHTHRSQFENVFFNMTSTFEEIVSHLEYIDGEEQDNLYMVGGSNGDGKYDENGNPIGTIPFGVTTNTSPLRYKKGREIFRYLYCIKQFTPETGQTISGIKELIELNPEMPLSKVKDYVFDGTLDHYFRYAYRILKYIDSSELINKTEKMEYASIFRAQLSCYELLILFINGIETDNNKFKKLIERYCMFNNLRVEMLPNTSNFYQLYESKMASKDGRERDGYAENAEYEYAIGAFCKPSERIHIKRLEIFQKVWELRFSKRVECERDLTK